MASDFESIGSDKATLVADAISEEGTVLEFQRYARFFENCQNYHSVGYMLLWSLGKEKDIVKIK